GRVRPVVPPRDEASSGSGLPADSRRPTPSGGPPARRPAFEVGAAWDGGRGLLRAPLDKGLADAWDGDRSDVQRVADLQVGPRGAGAAAVSLQQDAGPGQFAGRCCPLGDERFQLWALLLRQPHHELLIHDWTPVQRRGKNRRHWTEVRGTYQYHVDEALVS